MLLGKYSMTEKLRFAHSLRAILIVVCTGMVPAYAQYEVAEIPFFNTPEGTAALGGGIRLGQDMYKAFDDSSDQRQFDLVPLYLYNGKYLFFRGTAGGSAVGLSYV